MQGTGRSVFVLSAVVVVAFVVLCYHVEEGDALAGTWYPITPADPNTKFRYGHQACFSVNGTKKLVVFSGKTESYSYVQETVFFGYCTSLMLIVKHTFVI